MADQQYLMHVCKLQRALYGLKHAPRAWFDRLSDFLISYGFFYSFVDPSLFVFHSAHGILALLLYVDDMLLTGSSAELVNSFIHIVSCEFSMKDL
jgi:histone deacetylase 1/2